MNNISNGIEQGNIIYYNQIDLILKERISRCEAHSLLIVFRRKPQPRIIRSDRFRSS